MKKKWLMYALVGGVAYWFLFRKRSRPMPMIVSSAVLPTDSMMPGSLVPAVQGVVKEGQDLIVMQ